MPDARPDERERRARARPCPASPCPRRGRSPARSPRPRSPSCRAGARRARAPSPRRRSRSRAGCARPPASVLIARAAFSTGIASCAVRPRVEPRLRERRRLADHPVGRLRAERQLEPDACRSRCDAASAASSVRAGTGRGSYCVVAAHEPHVASSTPCARHLPPTPRGRSAPARPRAGTRTRRSPSCPRSSSGRGRCRARGRRARRAPCSPISARTRSSFASSRAQLTARRSRPRGGCAAAAACRGPPATR